MAKTKKVVKKATKKRAPRKKKLATALAPPPPDASKEKLEHYAQVCELNTRVLAKRLEFNEARVHARDLKKDLQDDLDELVWLIRRGPDPQKTLDFPDDGEKPDDNEVSSETNIWRTWRVDRLKLSRGIVTLLCDFGLETLGQLRDFWREGKVLHEAIKGLGEEKAAKVADAWAKLAKEYPEINE